MFTPKLFALDDRDAAHDIIRRHDFALLVTCLEGAPIATHLPFLLDPARGEHGTLTAHMARANPQWRDFQALRERGTDVLVAFTGPHAYVSPRWYGPGDAVPTWNYLAVHAYGPAHEIDDPEAVRAYLERLVASQEASADTPWSLDGQSENFVSGIMRGIVAFEIPIRRLEAKAKLSQNKDEATRAAVRDNLAASEDPTARSVAERMRST